MRTNPDLERALVNTRLLLRLRGYWNRTVHLYAQWLRRFMEAHGSAPEQVGSFRMRTNPDLERALVNTRLLLRLRGYWNRTVHLYAQWLRRFMEAHPDTPVEDLTRRHVEEFLSVLTEQRRLAPKSRNQAASALAFFFREVLGRDDLGGMPRAREPQRIPTVLFH